MSDDIFIFDETGTILKGINDRAIKSITIPNSVTSIGMAAFSWCPNLSSVTIGASVTNIGESAFSYCHSLLSVKIPDNVKIIGKDAFSNCKKLNSISFENGLKEIGNSAFTNCHNLISIIIPEGVKALKDNVFSGCKKLTSVTIPEGVESIGNETFKNCICLTSIKIPNSMTIIEDGAFEDCTALSSIRIPNNVKRIGNHAFSGCKDLISVFIGNNVKRIGDYAFKGCFNLKEINIPNSVTFIGKLSFEGCTNLPKEEDGLRYADTYLVKADNKDLKECSIKKGTRLISKYAFKDCAGLESVFIPDSVTNIETSIFEDCIDISKIEVDKDNPNLDSRNECNAIIDTVTNTLKAGCKKTIIPEDVTCIGDYAFYNCSSLVTINIPDSVTDIGNYAFMGCIRLVRIVNLKSVVHIGEYAFAGCPISRVCLPKATKYEKNSFDKITVVVKSRIFISYSWGDEEHKAWVMKFASDLNKRVDVILDREELKAGDSKAAFINEIHDADKVICILTPEYKRKAETGEGELGKHEYPIIRNEIKNRKDISKKYIPLLRKGTDKESIPAELSDLIFADFRNDKDYETNLNELLETL